MADFHTNESEFRLKLLEFEITSLWLTRICATIQRKRLQVLLNQKSGLLNQNLIN